MNLPGMPYQPFFDWLMRTTVQAGLLVVVILVLQRILGPRLGARGRHCLWLVLLIRMAMPWAPQSHVSLYNVLPLSRLESRETWGVTTAHPVGSVGAAADGRPMIRQQEGRDVSKNAPAGDFNSQEEQWSVGRTVRGLSLLWFLGACALAGYTLTRTVRLWRVVRRGQLVTNRETLDLLAACQRLIGTRAAVAVIATDRLGSPALFGCFRPRLLLPSRTLAQASPTELRHIFLHELAHLKRHDVLIAHIAGGLGILHWFNPLVAVGLRRMHADRELACDAAVLSLLDPQETRAYGRTVIKQIERLLVSPHRPALIGLGGSRTRTRERIAMIARFRRETYRWSPWVMVVMALLTCTGLTDRYAVRSIPNEVVALPIMDWDAYARRDFPTTCQDKHTNIQRVSLRNVHTGKYLAVNGEVVTCDAHEPGEAGLWEYRFDALSNSPQNTAYFYSVAARKYLTSDKEGNLAVNASEPIAAARWAAWPQSVHGVWILSYEYKRGYLDVDKTGRVRARRYGVNPINHTNNPRSFWDIHAVWRIKTSDDPKSNPQWQREKIPGPDRLDQDSGQQDQVIVGPDPQ